MNKEEYERRETVRFGLNKLQDAFEGGRWELANAIIEQITEDLPKFEWHDSDEVKWDVNKLLIETRQVRITNPQKYTYAVITLLQTLSHGNDLRGYTSNVDAKLSSMGDILEMKLQFLRFKNKRLI